MNWQIINKIKLKQIKKEKILPWAKGSPVPFLVEEESVLYWLIPPDGENRDLAACLLKPEELNERTAWELMLKFSPANPFELACYATGTDPSRIPLFLTLMNQKVNQKTVSDWVEMGGFDPLTKTLYERYEFPVGILRLWNRIPDDERIFLLEFFQDHRINKNHIREILTDYYDLNGSQREEFAAECRRLAQNWESSKSPFPVSLLRDSIKKRRFPLYAKTREEAGNIIKQLHLPAEVQIELPPDMESEELEIRIRIKDRMQYEATIRHLSSETAAEGIQNILERIR